MRNFVDYEKQGVLFPSIFIGYVGWPSGWQWSETDGVVYIGNGASAPVDVEVPAPIIVTEHQTAGLLCNHLQLFGLFFAVESLELYKLATKHGYEDLWPPVKWGDLQAWSSAIERFGLRFEDTEYQYMQEAFMPFGGRAAFEYAQKNNLRVILPTGDRGSTCQELFATYDDMHKYLRDAYERARLWRPDGIEDPLADLIGCDYPPPCGAIVYENSD